MPGVSPESPTRRGLPVLQDATGTRYPPRTLGLKLLDTTVRSVAVAASLWVVAGVWGLFH